MGLRTLAAAAAAFVACSPAAASELLASCGAVAGHAYYPNNGVIQEKHTGWTEDRISSGNTTLVRRDDGTLDLLFTDSTGASISARGDGGEVLLLRQAGSEAAVIVAYPRVLELYHYVREPSGRLVVMHLQTKTGTISKGALMVGTCSALPVLTAKFGN